MRAPSGMTLAAIAVAVLLGLAVRGGGRAQEAPRHDDYVNYELVQVPLTQPGFTDEFSTMGATTEPGEPGCAGASVWYVIVPEASARMVIDTAGSDFGTAIGVYRITDFAPSPPGGSLQEIACTGAPDAQVSLSFDMQAGQGLYALQVGGWQGQQGYLRLRIACDPACVPINDAIDAATYVFGAPHLDMVDTTAATLETNAGEPQPCGDIGRTVWYRFGTFDRGGDAVSVIATSAGFTPVIAVYEIDFSRPSPPGLFSNVVGCVTDPSQDFLTLTFTTKPHTGYLIQVGGANDTGGPLSVLVSCGSDAGCSFSIAEPPDDSATLPPGAGGEAVQQGGGGVAPPDTGSGGYRRH